MILFAHGTPLFKISSTHSQPGNLVQEKCGRAALSRLRILMQQGCQTEHAQTSVSEVTASVFLHAYTQEESAYHLLGPVEIRQTKMQKQNKQKNMRKYAAAVMKPQLMHLHHCCWLLLILLLLLIHISTVQMLSITDDIHQP